MDMIIIIGAGLAGLAAAQKLKEAGIEDFIIVEAQDYIGGRIKETPNFSENNLGAEWLYGREENPIYGWLESGAHKISSKSVQVTFDGPFATQDGRSIPIDRVQSIIGGASQAKRMLDVRNPFVPDYKLQSVNNFKAALNQIAEHCSQNATDEEKKIANAVKEWIELHEATSNSCEEFDDLSTRAYSRSTNYDKDKLLGLNWKLVVDNMAKTIDKNRIYLNTPVDHIEYSTESVRVLMASGLEFICKHVLITVPISIIRKVPWLETPYSFIEPKLSQARQTLMDRVGFGPVTKIFLTFTCGSLHGLDRLKLLWTSNPEDVGLPSWTKDIVGFEEYRRYYPRFVARVGRNGSREVEKLSDMEIATIFLKVIKLFLPETQTMEIKSIQVSRWNENKYIGGAFTYPSIQSDEHDLSPAWEPICVCNHAAGDVEPNETVPRILFAGEATAGEHCGTAHGAIMSGWREADRLLKFIAPVQPKPAPEQE